MKKRSAYLVVKRVSIVVGSASILAIGVSLFQLTKGAGASSSPFQGVAAAQNAAAGGLNATALTELQGLQANAGGDIRGQVVSNARQLTSNVVGHPAFMIPTEAGDFCIFVEQVGESCMTPLSSSNPVLFTVTDRDGPSGVGPTAWGIASDGIISITFTEAGATRTVPVHGNVFAYVGAPSDSVADFTNIVANFADGHSVPAN